MLIRMILWVLHRRIQARLSKDRKFRYLLRDKTILLQIALRSGRGVRYFNFHNGAYSSDAGWHKYAQSKEAFVRQGIPVTVFTFSSAFEGARLLVKSAGNSEVMLDAIRDKKLVVKGDFTTFIWFGWLADQL